jgi:multidrug resistance efflux pump
VKKYLKYLLTGIVALIAAAVVLHKYREYIVNPWTRDGQVRAEVIQITPRVSGPIVDLPIRDNQFVKAGDLFFAIDPRTFEISLEQARAQLDETGDDVQALERQVDAAEAAVEASRAAVRQAKSAIRQLDATIEKNRAEYERRKDLLPKKATSKRLVETARASYEVSIQQRVGAVAALAESRAALLQSQAALAKAQAQLGALGKSNPQIRAALAAVRQAELNLEFTRVRAPVDGYVTNLNLRLGSQAVANQPALALVDVNSYWIDGFFRENAITDIHGGDRAIVTLMTYPDTPIEGHVDSIAWGIAQQDGSTGFELLPTISATFEWIRLAQRVPVRIHLTDVPRDVKLRVGTTCSVLVMTGTADGDHDKPVPAAPKALQ